MGVALLLGLVNKRVSKRGIESNAASRKRLPAGKLETREGKEQKREVRAMRHQRRQGANEESEESEKRERVWNREK